MKRDEVPLLLARAADGLPEPELTDAAWAAGVAYRRKQRRSIIAGVIAFVLVVVAGVLVMTLGGDRFALTPPDTPSPPPGSVPPAGQIAGITYWNAPPAGSEPFLDRVSTPLGDLLRVPDNPEDLRNDPIDRLAAVVLAPAEGKFVPLFLGADSRWAQAPGELQPIATGLPLSAGAIAPNGKLVAFPQPGAVHIIDASTAMTRSVTLPSRDIRSVSWLPNSTRLLASGPGAAYRLDVDLASNQPSVVGSVAASHDADDATTPYRLDGVAGQVALRQYAGNNGWVEVSNPQLPVASWVGQTFDSGASVGRMFVASELAQVPTVASQAQVLATISALQPLDDRLLVFGETPAATPTPGRSTPDRIREPGCCFLLGWYDQQTALLQVTDWLLAWNLRSGQVRRVTELEVDGVALGPGVRR
ncbi:hypothetical protein [Kribbella sp. CA-293567]|uniref:hypothetical protein n=1 Tax=Kribbella sp. CA-293567 TaxID=3002436 RepID=UPI0022DE7764|nr:hypothetical protein [Kribbella sp. CA-293567]WBQ07678.1 hypothetical protein OX958_12930 [Kribbella sp. CA-293567]